MGLCHGKEARNQYRASQYSKLECEPCDPPAYNASTSEAANENPQATPDEPVALINIVMQTSLNGKQYATSQDKINWLLAHYVVPTTLVHEWITHHRLPTGLPDWSCILTLLVAHLSARPNLAPKTYRRTL